MQEVVLIARPFLFFVMHLLFLRTGALSYQRIFSQEEEFVALLSLHCKSLAFHKSYLLSFATCLRVEKTS